MAALRAQHEVGAANDFDRRQRFIGADCPRRDVKKLNAKIGNLSLENDR